MMLAAAAEMVWTRRVAHTSDMARPQAVAAECKWVIEY